MGNFLCLSDLQRGLKNGYGHSLNSRRTRNLCGTYEYAGPTGVLYPPPRRTGLAERGNMRDVQYLVLLGSILAEMCSYLCSVASVNARAVVAVVLECYMQNTYCIEQILKGSNCNPIACMHIM